MRKLSQIDFINSCLKVHGCKYDYSLSKYNNLRSKIKIICNQHGIFKQNAKNHKDGQGCPICAGRVIKSKKDYLPLFNEDKYDYSLVDDVVLTNKDYIRVIDKSSELIYIQLVSHHKNGKTPSKIESKSLVSKFEEIHNNKYEYIIEKETYYATDKIKIINKLTSDQFYYRVDRHLLGMSPNKVTLNYFLLKSKETHGDKYDYSLIDNIKSNGDKVKIICHTHGPFVQRVSNHMNLGDGCPKCVGVGRWNTELLISEFKKVHKDKFDYSGVIFENVSKKVEIICNIHGKFTQNIHKHLTGQGCKKCETTSRGEEYVSMWLDEMNIKYIRQYKFDNCRYINPLYFDFYLPDYDTCIEFDGEQHYKPVLKFGGVEEFNKQIKRDKTKNNWCSHNNINLIRIRYNEVNKIKYILQEKLQLVDKK